MKRSHLFLLVGIFNTAPDFAVFTLLTLFVFRDPSQIAIAGVVSGTIALCIAFLTHNFITWRERETTRYTALKFFLVTGFGMWVLRPILLSAFIQLSVLYESVHAAIAALGIGFSLSFITNTGAFAFMTAVILVYNFFTYDRFTFSKNSRTENRNH